MNHTFWLIVQSTVTTPKGFGPNYTNKTTRNLDF